MKIRSKISPGLILPGVLAISSITGIMTIAVISTIANTSINNASALTYSSDTDVSFTFNPTLSISLSNADINIDNLLPGLSSESSPITVHVNSNTPYGYSLFASVGNSTDYNTTSLVHSGSDNSNNNSSNNNNNSNNNNSIPATFTSIATNASLPQLDTDSTWGYSFSNDNGSTWSNYNGLPLYSTVGNNTSTNNPALLIDTKNPADSTESIDFKIAAKASSTQASGTYNNVINFYAVGKPEPPLYMQDVAAIKAKLKNEHDTTTAIDQRDGREYTIAKLKDGKIWMTQNLDLAGGTKLYSETSDVPEGYSESSDNPYTTLLDSSETAPAGGRQSLYNVPYDQPDRTDCENNHPCYSYYSWLVATAGSIGNYQDHTARYSICPKGWKLPSFIPESGSPYIDSNSDYFALLRAYGTDLDIISPSGAYYDIGPSFLEQTGYGTVPNLSSSGESLYSFGGGYSVYWSSSWSNTGTSRPTRYYAYVFKISGDNMLYQRSSESNVRYPVRCLIR